MKKTTEFQKYPICALLYNLLIVYLMYTICRLLFVWCNGTMYAGHLSTPYLLKLLVAGTKFDTTSILYTNSWMILLFLLPLHWKENNTYYKVLRWIFVIVNSLCIYINLCDCAYFPYSGKRTTLSVLQEFGGESNFLTIVWNEAGPYWYLFIAAFIMSWLLWKMYCRPTRSHEFAQQKTWQYYILQLCCLLLGTGLTIGGIRGGFTTAVRPITMSNANQYVENANDTGIILNTPFCLIRSIGKRTYPETHYMDDEEAYALFSPVHLPADSAQFKEMNVVIMILESFGTQAQVLGYMPFVDSLAHVGKSFQYSFSNGRKSIDGMPSILTSVPYLIEHFFLTPACLNELSGIAGELTKHKGYTSAFFHGAENGSMGFQAFANASGFQQYFGRDEYNLDTRYHGDADFDGTWAIWDEEFLQFYCDKMDEFQEPFITSVFTATSHPPFAIPDRYRSMFPKTDPEIFAPIQYSDHAIRLFFEKASQQPWFQNTLFVLTADHATSVVQPEFQTDLGNYRVPVILYSPSMPELSGVDSTHIMSQIDIMPTVLSLLGYDRPFIAFGHDALNTPLEDQYAVSYLPTADWFQYIQGDWFLQTDGQKVLHAYRYKEDKLMQHDLCGQHPQEYEKRLNSIIQQYTSRLLHNKMVYDNQ